MSKSEWPKISIVTPSLNQGQYLESAIESVLSQEYPNLEYIIIDGGSTDNSLEIIEKYSRYLSYWCSKPDEGHYFAVNKGFSKAKGDIFAWLNSDDLYCPDALNTVGTLFRLFPNVSWLTTLKQLTVNGRGECKSTKHMPGFSKEAFLDGLYFTRHFHGIGFIQQESTFWKRELWEKVGGIRTKFDLAGDFDLWARFFLTEDLYGVDQPLGAFRVHGKNRSLESRNYINQSENSLNEVRMVAKWTPNTNFIRIHNLFKWNMLFHVLVKRCNKYTQYGIYTSKIISRIDSPKTDQWRMITAKF